MWRWMMPGGPLGVPASLRDMDRSMRHAAWAAGGLLLLTITFFVCLETLWGHPLEWIWATAVGGLTAYLLVAQWRLAGYRCPRCGGYWLASHWALANPFGLHRHHCHHCGMKDDEPPEE